MLQDQYAFIHDAVLETLICGDTQIPASDIQRALDRLKKADKNFDGPGMTGFHKQFQVNNDGHEMRYCLSPSIISNNNGVI